MNGQRRRVPLAELASHGTVTRSNYRDPRVIRLPTRQVSRIHEIRPAGTKGSFRPEPIFAGETIYQPVDLQVCHAILRRHEAEIRRNAEGAVICAADEL